MPSLAAMGSAWSATSMQLSILENAWQQGDCLSLCTQRK